MNQQRKPMERNEMSEGIELFSCKNQGKIFKSAVKMGFDIEDFVVKYIQTETCKEIDSFYSPLQTYFDDYVMSCILDEIVPKRTDKKQDENMAEWVGYSYRYIQIRTALSTYEIYEKLPFDLMVKYYEKMNGHDYEEFMNDLNKGNIL